MCQTCVDEGHLSQFTYNAIEKFNDEHFWAQFGPGHVVLADANVGDDTIKNCIAYAQAALSHDPNDLPDPVADLPHMEELDWYVRQNPDDIKATIVFLEYLLTIPEEVR